MQDLRFRAWGLGAGVQNSRLSSYMGYCRFGVLTLCRLVQWQDMEFKRFGVPF